MDERQKQILQECERFGEDEVRRRLNAGEYTGSQDRRLIQGWLRNIESKREEEVDARREAREKTTLEIANEANDLARSANRIALDAAESARKQARWAMWAAIIATIAIIIAAMAYIKTS